MTPARLRRPTTRFELPPDAHARRPPEHDGRRRDEVALVVARPGSVTTTSFARLSSHLEPGDLVVVNTSATVPAALDGWDGDRMVVVHLSTQLDDGAWVVELRHPDGTGPVLDAAAGEAVSLAGGASAVLRRPRALAGDGVRLWVADVSVPDGCSGIEELRARHARPITYAHLDVVPTLAEVQPAVARHPGSAEMASAGRPLTPAVVTDLVTSGVMVAPVTLHAGVSSQEVGEAPQPERFEVPPVTARLVEHTRATRGRVVAVGTTVVRALESAVGPDGRVAPRGGWTDRVVSSDDPPRVVTGLVTGWHDPTASHLLLLEAVAGPSLVAAATEEALARGLRWHEFGDSCLLLP